jgi:hypothetical protein
MDKPFMFYKVIQVKFQVLNSNLEVTFAQLVRLIKLVKFGIYTQGNVCILSKVTLTKF